MTYTLENRINFKSKYTNELDSFALNELVEKELKNASPQNCLRFYFKHDLESHVINLIENDKIRKQLLECERWFDETPECENVYAKKYFCAVVNRCSELASEYLKYDDSVKDEDSDDAL